MTHRPVGWRSKGWTPFQMPDNRWVLAAQPTGNLTGPDVIAFAVADPGGHPLDLGPIALLDRDRVEDLVGALQAWLRLHP